MAGRWMTATAAFGALCGKEVNVSVLGSNRTIAFAPQSVSQTMSWSST